MKKQPHKDAGVCFTGLFAFALLSFKLQFSVANTTFHHMCEGIEGWRGGAASDDSAPPLRLQKSLIISIYPPQIPVGLAEGSFPLYPPQWKNYPNHLPSQL